MSSKLLLPAPVGNFTFSIIFSLRSQFENVPIWPICALGSNFNLQNTKCIPVVKIIARLDLGKTKTLWNRLFVDFYPVMPEHIKQQINKVFFCPWKEIHTSWHRKQLINEGCIQWRRIFLLVQGIRIIYWLLRNTRQYMQNPSLLFWSVLIAEEFFYQLAFTVYIRIFCHISDNKFFANIRRNC